MTPAEDFFNELIKEIPYVRPGKMFGSLCMKTPDGKSGSMLWHDNIVVKLDGVPFREALGLEGSQLFEPMEGRPMKEWVQIPFTHKEVWKKFALISASSVVRLKKKRLG